jgi:hypothetical protein
MQPTAKEDTPMGNLKYNTFRNGNHHGHVKTWTDNSGTLMLEIAVDGVTRFHGEVSDADE